MRSRGRNLLFVSALLIFSTISSVTIVEGLLTGAVRADSVNLIGQKDRPGSFVLDLHDKTVSIISGQTKTVIGIHTVVSRYPAIVTFASPSSGNKYVVNLHDNTLSIISGQTKTVIGNPVHPTNAAGETSFGFSHPKSYNISTSHNGGLSGAMSTRDSSNLAVKTASPSKALTTPSHPPLIP